MYLASGIPWQITSLTDLRQMERAIYIYFIYVRVQVSKVINTEEVPTCSMILGKNDSLVETDIHLHQAKQRSSKKIQPLVVLKQMA